MGKWILPLTLVASIGAGLPARAQDTADTGGATGGTTDGGTTDGGTTEEQLEDTQAYVPGRGAAELAGDVGGCQSVLSSGAAALFLIVGAGSLIRRER